MGRQTLGEIVSRFLNLLSRISSLLKQVKKSRGNLHLDKSISKAEFSCINDNHFTANLDNVCFGNPEDLMARIDRGKSWGFFKT